MMNPICTVLLMALVTYISRLAGFVLSGQKVAPFWLRFLRFVPICVFATLIVPAIPGVGGTSVRLIAAAVAGALMLYRGGLTLGLTGGLATFVILRFLSQH